jgi:ATP-dependent DNA ligase
VAIDELMNVLQPKPCNRVRMYSRPGNDLTHRFPLVVEALARPRARSCNLDGEARLKRRKADLVRTLASAGPGLRINEWIEDSAIDGAIMFGYACKLGLEGIVSKAQGLALPVRQVR